MNRTHLLRAPTSRWSSSPGCARFRTWSSREYRDSVLPSSIRLRLAVEAGVAQGWRRYVGDAGDVLGMSALVLPRWATRCWRTTLSRPTTSVSV